MTMSFSHKMLEGSLGSTFLTIKLGLIIAFGLFWRLLLKMGALLNKKSLIILLECMKAHLYRLFT